MAEFSARAALFRNMSETDNPTPPLQLPERPPARRGKRLFTGIVATILVVLLALAAWMYLPVLQNKIAATPSATPLPPSATPSQTSTPSPSPTVTNTPIPTATLLPPSAFLVPTGQIYPPVPDTALSAMVLNEDSAAVEPGFDHPQWYSAEQISQQIGILISEPFYATVGSGAVTWQMDLPLQPGLYELFVLDTLYSSGGSLDFRVSLGQRELSPLLGIQHVQYSTLSGIPAQNEEQWRSIGLYDLDSIDLLTVQTTWEAREMATIVAIDRLLIVRRSDTIRTFLAQLPANSPKFVVDDSSARIESSAVWFTRNDLPAWGDQFQIVVNPEANSKVTWQVPARVPPGQYEIWVYAPAMEGNADLLYKVLVNGQESQGALVVSTGNMPDNQWVSLGAWQAQADPNLFTIEEGYVTLGLSLDIPQGSLGEISIDAVAFIFRE